MNVEHESHASGVWKNPNVTKIALKFTFIFKINLLVIYVRFKEFPLLTGIPAVAWVDS